MRTSKVILLLSLGLLLCCGLSFAAGKKKDEVKWKEHKKQHFIIYYKKAPLDFVETVAQAAERYYIEIARDLGFNRDKGWTWDDRAQIYIFDDQDDYVKNSKQVHWSWGTASAKKRLIKTFPSASGFFDTLLPHELGHIIFGEFVGPKANYPRWFNEGVAKNQERAKGFGSDKIVIKAIENGTFIPIQDLQMVVLNKKTSREKIDLFYAESSSIVSFMINEYGSLKFLRFCRKLKEGGTFQFALRSVYVRFKSYQDLNDAWVNYLKKK